jgi:hypothetical protein
VSVLAQAELRAQLVPLIAAAARGELFDSRFYDAALWRAVARFVSTPFGGFGQVASLEAESMGRVNSAMLQREAKRRRVS